MVILTIVGCNKKTSTYEIKKTINTDTYKTEKVIGKIIIPKLGFKCEMENLDNGEITKVFYIKRLNENSNKALYHQFYSVNTDDTTVVTNITIGTRQMWIVQYDSEEDGIYNASVLTSKAKEAAEVDDENILFVNAKVVFDSKINEFDITIISSSIDEDGHVTSINIGSAKINNCIESSITVPY